MKKKKIKEEQKDGQIKRWKKKIAWAWVETMANEVFCFSFWKNNGGGKFLLPTSKCFLFTFLPNVSYLFFVRVVYYPT
jgi:hypothetical protein